MKVVRRGTQTRRSGSTLVEVLMSLLVFSIGAVAVATLFPASILQSLNATQLTRGTIHRYNAEALVDLFPDELVHDPLGLAGNPANDLLGYANTYFGKNYIVDPLGWNEITSSQGQFGNNSPTGRFLPRYNGGFNTPAKARSIAVAPDSWVAKQFVNDLQVSSPTATSVVVSGVSSGDLGEVSTGTHPSQITLFDGTAKFSITRRISSINTTNGTVNWSTPLPAEWQPGGIHTPTTAHIATQEFQFSWLLTVRNRGELRTLPANAKGKAIGLFRQQLAKLQANVDVVVFFNRSFGVQDERIYALTKVGPQDYTITIPGGGQRPFLKKGAFLCDVVNARWYRIQKITGKNSASPRIRLEHSPPVGENITEAVFLPGVVEVYSIGTK